MFVNQTSFISDIGVHPSVHPDYHHQIVSVKPSLELNTPIYSEWLVLGSYKL